MKIATLALCCSCVVGYSASALCQSGGETADAEQTSGSSFVEPPLEFASEDPESSWEERQEQRKLPYQKFVAGRLWIEGFGGPSLYDPDRRAKGLTVNGAAVDVPTSSGPEFGALIGFAIEGALFGTFYRQANYDGYKLMKAGADLQIWFQIPYVDWVLRSSFAYARTFDGSPFPTLTSSNGFSGSFGTGIRVPIVRWISLIATIDLNRVRLFVPEETFGRRSAVGLQLIGTFGLTLHFIGS